MSIEANKRVAAQFFERFSANDIQGALDTMSDDATWWIAGKKEEQLPTTGVFGKEKIGRLFYRLTGELKGGLNMTVKGMVAEGDKVAVEVESYGELKNGRVYRQEYHTLMTVRDGKISAVREYLDTHHVFATWFAP